MYSDNFVFVVRVLAFENLIAFIFECFIRVFCYCIVMVCSVGVFISFVKNNMC